MNESVFSEIAGYAGFLKLDLTVREIAVLSEEMKLEEKDINAISALFRYLKDKKNQSIVDTCLRLSRLPQKEPRTFENFDFNMVHGKDVEKLRSVKTLSALHSHRNLAFIGPQGVGKTHLAMAFGRACCEKGLKTYFIKASELNDKLTLARSVGKSGKIVNGLVKPSCLIIDEVGRCKFDYENTRIFFDIIDRRTNKDGPNCMIFTSNKAPNVWSEYFSEDDTLLCALDRIFDEATVYMMKGDSFRGRRLETVAIETGFKKLK